jgi:DNA-binding transcriptional LysR family regulator
MTLDQLRIFLEVAQRGHVTQAAKMLNLTQSAVSASISTLESTHSVKLFDRIGRGITLTEAGRTFAQTAQALLAQAETARLVLRDLAEEPRGRLRIHASQTVASYWLPKHLVDLHERYPEIEISLTLGNTRQVAEAVVDGTADMGFVEGETPHNDLMHRVVARDELVLILSRNHPMVDQEKFSLHDYRRFNWIIREPGSGTRSEFEEHLSNLTLTSDDLKVSLELPSNEAILAAVSHGSCVSMLSQRATIGAALSGSVKIRQVTWAPRPERPFAVLTHPDRYRTRAVDAMLAIACKGK